MASWRQEGQIDCSMQQLPKPMVPSKMKQADLFLCVGCTFLQLPPEFSRALSAAYRGAAQA